MFAQLLIFGLLGGIILWPVKGTRTVRFAVFLAGATLLYAIIAYLWAPWDWPVAADPETGALRTAAIVLLGLAYGVVLYEAAKASRTRKVGATRRRSPLPLFPSVLVVLLAATAILLLDPALPAALGVALLAGVALVYIAREFEKRRFQLLTVIIALVLIGVVLHVAGNDGCSALASSVDTYLCNTFTPALPDRTGIDVLVSALALAGAVYSYRVLELVNNKRYGAPIAVTPIVGLEDAEQQSLTQRLRERTLAAAGVVEPTTVPGGTTSEEVAKFITEVAGSQHNTVVAAAVTLLQKTAFPPPGMRVTTSITWVPHAWKAGTYEACVELTTRATGLYVDSIKLQAKDKPSLIDIVAPAVATIALEYSTTAPSWANWQDDGRSLTAYARAVRDEAASRQQLTRGQRKKEYIRAHQLSPNNALVRLSLAHQYELEENRMAALRLHLQTAMDYPTMILGRYRLATSLVMIARDEKLSYYWNPDTQTTREIATLLGDRYREGLSSRLARRDIDTKGWSEERVSSTLQSGPLNGQLQSLFVDMARIELGTLDRHIGWLNLIWWSARKDERRDNIKLLLDSGDRARWRATFKTVHLSAPVGVGVQHGDPRRREKMEKLASFENTTSPTAHYNAACFYALASEQCGGGDHDLDEALRHLREALRRGGSQMFRPGWLRSDPDLAALQKKRRRQFKELCETYTAGG